MIAKRSVQFMVGAHHHLRNGDSEIEPGIAQASKMASLTRPRPDRLGLSEKFQLDRRIIGDPEPGALIRFKKDPNLPADSRRRILHLQLPIALIGEQIVDRGGVLRIPDHDVGTSDGEHLVHPITRHGRKGHPTSAASLT